MVLLGLIHTYSKNVFKNRWIFPLLLLTGYGFLYFYVRDKIPFTPDFSGTDVLHFNFSYKYHLWKSIRSGIIPFWTEMLDGGFPLLAESQMGTFFLPHYVIFPFFSSFAHAYAFLFSFHLFLLSVGFYLLLREFKITPALSFLLSVIFAWNGAITFRWVHLTVLQSFSFTPLLFLFYVKWNESRKIIFLLFISLIVNQMIFAGYIQSVFIALLGLIILYVIQNYPIDRIRTGAFACSLLVGFLLSAPQLIPTLQLSHYSSRPISSSYDFAVSVPFTIHNMCSFFSADCLGSPQKATYSANWQADGIYWENTPYLGELFIIILILSSTYFFTAGKRNRLAYTFLLLFLLFLLLALGRNSPLYFVFSIFPFTMFRSPPRYLLISVFFLILYSSFILNQVLKKSTFISLVIYTGLILNCILLVRTALMYHLFIDSSSLLQSLSTQAIVKPDSRYVTYGGSEQWQKVFVSQGWKSEESIREYLFINRALLPNTNLISGHRSFDSYASLGIRRHQFLKSIIAEGLNAASHSSIEGSQSARLERILQLYSINTVISFKKLFLPHYKPVQTMKEGVLILTTYQNLSNSNISEYYVPKTIKKVSNLEEFEKNIYSSDLTEEKSIAESIQDTITQSLAKVSVRMNKSKDLFMSGSVTSDADVFIVFRRNWYPEWRLYIDGKEHTLFRTNLLHMGFIVPKGVHIVELIYIPLSFYLGSAISLFVALIGALFLLKTIKRRK